MDDTEKLTIEVTTEQAKMIRECVDSGAFLSVSQLVQAALRSWRRHDSREERLADIREQIEAAIADARPRLSSDEVDERLEQLFQKALSEEAAKARRNGTV